MINQQLYDEDPGWNRTRSIDHRNAKHSPNAQSQPSGRFRSFESRVLPAFILTPEFPYLTTVIVPVVSAKILRRN